MIPNRNKLKEICDKHGIHLLSVTPSGYKKPMDVARGLVTLEQIEKVVEDVLESATESLYQSLTSQPFADWYGDGGQFDAHIRHEEFGATGAIPTKEQVMERLRKFLG